MSLPSAAVAPDGPGREPSDCPPGERREELPSAARRPPPDREPGSPRERPVGAPRAGADVTFETQRQRRPCPPSTNTRPPHAYTRIRTRIHSHAPLHTHTDALSHTHMWTPTFTHKCPAFLPPPPPRALLLPVPQNHWGCLHPDPEPCPRLFALEPLRGGAHGFLLCWAPRAQRQALGCQVSPGPPPVRSAQPGPPPPRPDPGLTLCTRVPHSLHPAARNTWVPLRSLALQDGWPRYRDDSGMDSCCRKRLCTATATFSISHSTVTAPARLGRGRGPWGPGLNALVSAGLAGCSGPGAGEDPGAWVMLSEELPAGHEKPKADVGLCSGTATRARPVGPAGRGQGDSATGTRGTRLCPTAVHTWDCTVQPQPHSPALHAPASLSCWAWPGSRGPPGTRKPGGPPPSEPPRG